MSSNRLTHGAHPKHEQHVRKFTPHDPTPRGRRSTNAQPVGNSGVVHHNAGGKGQMDPVGSIMGLSGMGSNKILIIGGIAAVAIVAFYIFQ